jgi:hypothetical protein
MSEVNLYGPIVTRRQIGVALRDHLIGEDGWFPFYLREVQRLTGWADELPDAFDDWPPTFASHRFTVSETTVLNLPENDLPALLIGSPGIVGEPQTHSEDKALEGAWAFGLHALVSADDEDSTDRLAGEYAAALMAACAQQRKLGNGFATIESVSDMAFDAIPQYASRTLAAGTVTVLVVVEEMVHSGKGPTELPADPNVDPGADPEVLTTTLTVDHMED